MQWIKWVTCFCSSIATDHRFPLKMLLLITVTTCVGTYGGQSSQRSLRRKMVTNWTSDPSSRHSGQLPSGSTGKNQLTCSAVQG